MIINAHVPIEEKDGNTKELFYQHMETYIIQHQDAKIFLGDLNAKIGKEKEYIGIIGKHSCVMNQ